MPVNVISKIIMASGNMTRKENKKSPDMLIQSTEQTYPAEGLMFISQ
jgi:hypothetical protein